MYKQTSSSHNLFSISTKKQIKAIKDVYKAQTIGICFSAFDILHCGHILMLEDAKRYCDVLVVGLHTDPTLNRDSKNKPIQELEERRIQLKGCKYINEIIEYATEDDLMQILHDLKPNVRILGTDWKDKLYTGYKLNIPVVWHSRNHNWSTTYLRDRIYEVEKTKHKDDKVTFIQQDTPTHYTIREI